MTLAARLWYIACGIAIVLVAAAIATRL